MKERNRERARDKERAKQSHTDTSIRHHHSRNAQITSSQLPQLQAETLSSTTSTSSSSQRSLLMSIVFDIGYEDSPCVVGSK